MMLFIVVLCQVGQLEGVQLVLDCSQMDAKNPFITQWAVLAIRVGTDMTYTWDSDSQIFATIADSFQKCLIIVVHF